MEREDEQRDLEKLDKMTDSLGEKKMGDCQHKDPHQWDEINDTLCAPKRQDDTIRAFCIYDISDKVTYRLWRKTWGDNISTPSCILSTEITYQLWARTWV